jgi:hypothetical protein
MKPSLKIMVIASALMLILALGDMPYGYYLLLKIAVCTTLVMLALRLNEVSAGVWVIAAWAFAALYNPIVKIPFHKDAWAAINLLTITVIWMLYRKAINAPKAGN